MTTPVTLTSASAFAENEVLVVFNEGVYFSGLLDLKDASVPALWSVSPVAGTAGYDGNPARPVSVVTVTSFAKDGSGNTSSVLLTLDRPMSPYPSQYTMFVEQVWSADRSISIVAATSSPFFAVYRTLEPAQVNTPSPGRDFANPQTLSAAVASTIAQPYQQLLGTLGNSPDHDYAIDKGDDGLRKRMTRRTFAKKNGFAFLPGYGIGITGYGKRLGKASVRDQLAAECEAQYGQEPEVAKVVVSIRPDAKRPSLMRLGIFIQKKSGKTARYSTLIPSE